MISSFKDKNVLVLAPHTDDGELGAGGTIDRLIKQGANVFYVAFSTAEESVPKHLPKDTLKTEVKKATFQLGIPPENLYVLNYPVRKLNYNRQSILEDLIKIRAERHWSLILMPCLSDIHQDHSTIAQEGLRAFKNTSILGYELLWNNLTFNTTCFVKLDPANVEVKINSLKEYASQSHREYMKSEFIKSLAKTRGVQIGSEWAEAFEVIRWIF